MATCFCPLLVLRLPITRGGSSECICRGSLSSLIFQSSLISLAFLVLMIFSSFCQLLRITSPPSVNQSAAKVTLPERIRIDRTTIRTLLIGRHLQRWCGFHDDFTFHFEVRTIQQNQSCLTLWSGAIQVVNRACGHR